MDWHSTPNQTGGSGDQFEIDLSLISMVSEMSGDASPPHSNPLPSPLSNEECSLLMMAAYNSGEQLPTENFLQQMLAEEDQMFPQISVEDCEAELKAAAQSVENKLRADLLKAQTDLTKANNYTKQQDELLRKAQRTQVECAFMQMNLERIVLELSEYAKTNPELEDNKILYKFSRSTKAQCMEELIVSDGIGHQPTQSNL